MADEAGLVGTGAGRAARDPSSLEVLGSSSSDENKTLLTSSLYMTGNKTGGAGVHAHVHVDAAVAAVAALAGKRQRGKGPEISPRARAQSCASTRADLQHRYLEGQCQTFKRVQRAWQLCLGEARS